MYILNTYCFKRNTTLNHSYTYNGVDAYIILYLLLISYNIIIIYIFYFKLQNIFPTHSLFNCFTNNIHLLYFRSKKLCMQKVYCATKLNYDRYLYCVYSVYI